ncbi:hypothetical protein UFOVP557_21, partial [uncultured Caudovirales phage]
MPLTTYTAGEVLTAASLNANFTFAALGKVGQVQSTVLTSTFTTTSSTYTGVTGLTVAITPSSATSKVLVIAQISYAMGSSVGYGFFKLSGGNSGNYVGDAAGSRVQTVFGGYSNVNA